MAQSNLSAAKRAKNDEFYTQYFDIEKEIAAYIEYDPKVFRGKTILLPCDDPEWSNFTKFFAQNFEHLGLKKVISTSFAVNSKIYQKGYQPTLFETNDPAYDENKTRKRGKIFTLTKDTNKDGRIDTDDLQWQYLQGDGDFNSDEVKALRDEADFIITNPPFSKFRDFLAWIMAAEKGFLIIGNKNTVTCKEVFPLLKENKMWTGRTKWGSMWFEIVNPDDADKIIDGKGMKTVGAVWFTNIEHGRRHQPLALMNEADVVKFATQKPFEKYDNYAAIEVSRVKQIPSDYDGVMGVPMSFFDKYCPEQFEVLGITKTWFGAATKNYPQQIQVSPNGKRSSVTKLNDGVTLKVEFPPTNQTFYIVDNENYIQLYPRILIKHKNAANRG